MENKDLQVTTGAIAEVVGKVAEAKKQLQADIDKIYNDDTRTKEWKNQQITLYKDAAQKKIDGLRNEITENLAKIEGYVAKPFDFEKKPELDAKVDYIKTMLDAGCFSGGMIINILEEYRANEATLLYLRQKLVECGLNGHYFDDYLFSDFSQDTITGTLSYTPGSKFFEELNGVITTATPAMVLSGLGKLEKVLGVESEGLKNLTTEFTKVVDRPAIM